MYSETSAANRAASDRGMRHPAWLFAVVAAPHVLLLFLLGRDFAILRTEIQAEHVAYWQAYLGILGALGVALTAYAGWCLVTDRRVLDRVLSPALLLTYIAYLYSFFQHMTLLYPASVPDWMVAGDSGLIYTTTFLTPVLLYALLLGVFALTPREIAPSGILLNFLGVVFLPVMVYLFFMLITNVFSGAGARFWDFMIPVAVISATVLFLFLLIRALLLLGRGRLGAVLKTPAFQIPFRALIGVVFPVTGLYLNNNGDVIGMGEMTHIFGDFSHPGFYVLAVLNGAALLLPDREEPRYRVGLFLARLLLLPYSLYFCIVFLPYLPLAILAMILFGLGFLMLTPLVLTFVHIRVLLEDYKYLTEAQQNLRIAGPASGWNARTVLIAGLVGFLIWPLAISASYFHERRTLHAALDYVYQPDYARSRSDLDLRALNKTLLEIRRYKKSAGTPYLGLYYKWLVLDNLTVSDAKVDRLQLLFFGRTEDPPQPDGLWGNGQRGFFGGNVFSPPSSAELAGVRTRTTYDARLGLYHSTIDLTLRHPGGDQGSVEYRTGFRLPPGAKVAEYYLDIAGVRQYGMLAEKTSALWIYNQITSFRQDPGLLHYEEDRNLTLRVFPIFSGEQRTTGLEILHVEPFALELDGRRLELTAPGPRPGVIAFPEGVYVSAAVQTAAGSGTRRPYLSFVLDCSQQSAGAEQDAIYVRTIGDVIAGNAARDFASKTLPDVRLTCANFEFESRVLQTASPEQLRAALAELREAIPARGSFDLNRTLRALLVRYARGPERVDRFPVPVVLTARNSENSLTTQTAINDLAWLVPESPAFYLSDGDVLRRVAFADGSSRIVNKIEYSSVRQLAPETLAEAYRAAGLQQPARLAPVVLPGTVAAAIVPVLTQVFDPRESVLTTGISDTSLVDAALAGTGQGTERPETRATSAIVLAADAIELNHRVFSAEAAALHVPMIRASFAARLLLPSTSFLVVETEAQKIALQRKQDQTLKGHAALDAGEEPVRLNEPEFWLLLAACVLLFAYGALRHARARRGDACGLV